MQIEMSTAQIRHGNRIAGNASQRVLGEELTGHLNHSDSLQDVVTKTLIVADQ